MRGGICLKDGDYFTNGVIRRRKSDKLFSQSGMLSPTGSASWTIHMYRTLAYRMDLRESWARILPSYTTCLVVDTIMLWSVHIIFVPSSSFLVRKRRMNASTSGTDYTCFGMCLRLQPTCAQQGGLHRGGFNDFSCQPGTLVAYCTHVPLYQWRKTTGHWRWHHSASGMLFG